ncbi:related to retrotransposon HobS hobase (N-terminal fragment), partial [Serendipita indica DSM 11827]
SREPTTLGEALKRPDGDKYVQAATEEVRAHLENGTWKLVRLPQGKKAIGSRWVFKIKRDADGSISKYKGRIVAKGYAQREGIDYTETFTPTARFGALRTIIALAALEDWELDVFIYECDNVKIIVPVHIDDLLLASKSPDAIQIVKNELKARFKIRDQGPTSFLLGVKLERDRQSRTISLSQPAYIEQILETYEVRDCNGTDTPMAESHSSRPRIC